MTTSCGSAPIAVRHRARVFELVERAILERDRERLERPIDHPRHQRRDGAAVDAAGEEHAERHVAHQPEADRFLEQRAERRRRCRAAVAASGAPSAPDAECPSTASVRTRPCSKTSGCPGSSFLMSANRVSSPDT